MNRLVAGICILFSFSCYAELEIQNIGEVRRKGDSIAYWIKDGNAQINTICFHAKESPEYKDDYLDCLQDARLHFAHECLMQNSENACKAFKEISGSDDFLKAYWGNFAARHPETTQGVEKVSKTKAQTDR